MEPVAQEKTAPTIQQEGLEGEGQQSEGLNTRQAPQFSLTVDADPKSGGKATGAAALADKDLDFIAQQLNHGLLGPVIDAQRVFLNLQRLGKDAAVITKVKDKYNTQFKLTLDSHIKSMLIGESQRLALELIGIKSDPKAADVVGSKATTAADFKAVALRINTALGKTPPAKEEIFGALMPFNRDKTALSTLKTTYKTEHKTELASDLAAKFSGTEGAYALFLLNGHPTETGTTNTVKLDDKGSEDTSTVSGGQVKANTGAKYTPAGKTQRVGGFSMSYEGALANESRWLQFIWREIIVTKADGATVTLNDSITTTGGSYNLTTDPKKPSYNTDTAPGSASPFYESSGFNNRTADATTIFDRPSSADAFAQREFGKGAKKVVSRAHFNSFLIRDYLPVHQYSVTVQWDYANTTVPPNTQSLKEDKAVNMLPADMKARLVSQYPDYSYIL